MDNRRDQKHQIVSDMVMIYCDGHHKHTLSPCPKCQEVLDYSKFRTSKCPYIKKTLFCSNCPTPCYKPDMKEEMRVIMKYSGPRYFFKHPILVLKHGYTDIKSRKGVKS